MDPFVFATIAAVGIRYGVRIMVEIFEIAQAVPALITIVGSTITAYKAASTTQAKLEAVATGLQSALTEVQSVLKNMV